MKHALFTALIYASFPLSLLSTTATLTDREKELINHVQLSIDHAEKGRSKLTPSVLGVPGMTSHKVKHFLNNVCSMKNINYLEIGVWQGATFTAALYKNDNAIKAAVAIDDWSEYGGPAEQFERHCKDNITHGMNYKFYNHNSFTIDKSKLFNGPVDVYFYDGDHVELAQELAFVYYDSIFADSFIAIVDDWNHPPVKTGTRKAFAKLGYTVLFEREMPSNGNGDTQNWWNGYYIAVVRRNIK